MGQTLTVNEEGGRGRTLPRRVLGSDGVFSTVCNGGFADLQTEHIPGAAQSAVRCDPDLARENQCVRWTGGRPQTGAPLESSLTTASSFSHSTSGDGSPEISHTNLTFCPSSTFWERGCSRKWGASGADDGDVTLFGDLMGEVTRPLSAGGGDLGVGDLGVGDFGESGDFTRWGDLMGSGDLTLCGDLMGSGDLARGLLASGEVTLGGATTFSADADLRMVRVKWASCLPSLFSTNTV